MVKGEKRKKTQAEQKCIHGAQSLPPNLMQSLLNPNQANKWTGTPEQQTWTLWHVDCYACKNTENHPHTPTVYTTDKLHDRVNQGEKRPLHSHYQGNLNVWPLTIRLALFCPFLLLLEIALKRLKAIDLHILLCKLLCIVAGSH